MTSNVSRIAAAILGGMILSSAVGGNAANAQEAESVPCPCLTSSLVDLWFWRLDFAPDRPRQMFACVDETGFTTLDFLDRSEPRRAIYIDLSYPTAHTQARCLIQLTRSPNDIRAAGDMRDFRSEITPAEAQACRAQVLQSGVWRRLGCPGSKRNPG